MSQIPEDLRYTKNHEWARLLDDSSVQVGITDYAQHALGDMVYIDLPKLGNSYAAKAECAVVESVKSASDLYCPVAGEIVEVNEALNEHPEIVNQDPYGQGWIFRLRPNDVKDLDKLLEAKAYAAEIAAEEEE